MRFRIHVVYERPHCIQNDYPRRYKVMTDVMSLQLAGPSWARSASLKLTLATYFGWWYWNYVDLLYYGFEVVVLPNKNFEFETLLCSLKIKQCFKCIRHPVLLMKTTEQKDIYSSDNIMDTLLPLIIEKWCINFLSEKKVSFILFIRICFLREF